MTESTNCGKNEAKEYPDEAKVHTKVIFSGHLESSEAVFEGEFGAYLVLCGI